MLFRSLAPEAEFSHRDPNRPKSLAGELLRALRTGKTLDELREEDNKLEQGHDEDDDDEDLEPATIPTLEATADTGPDLTRINRRLCRKKTGGLTIALSAGGSPMNSSSFHSRHKITNAHKPSHAPPPR